MDSKASNRWVIVSQRLPFARDETGRFTRGPGGLISAITSVHVNQPKLWIGRALEHMSPQDWQSLRHRDQTEYAPVFIANGQYDAFYNGFCNNVLWPLLHYQTDLLDFHREDWRAYQQVNEIFAHRVSQIAQPNDLVWIHDFHFFLLPRYLKHLSAELRVGFFLHVPFPSSEIFRQLPVRREILEAVLASDLIGFHDYSYLRHFCATIQLLLGVDSSLTHAQMGHHICNLGVFPVSIDTEHFERQASTLHTHKLVQHFKQSRYLVLGVDRLDYTKGLDLKLKAFQRLLERYPQFHGKVSFLQVAVPTRTKVSEYQSLKEETDQLVGQINGQFSQPNYTPVQYLYRSISEDELIALYRAADVLMVSSKRDGMNLVALEYTASQDASHPGVLLLSEFTGASSVLSQAISINPWDIDTTAKRLLEALTMPVPEKIERHKVLMAHLKSYTATHWSNLFMDRLVAPIVEPTPKKLPEIEVRTITPLARQMYDARPSQIILMIDFDGTLLPIKPRPELARLSQPTYQALQTLTHRPDLKVVVVSGRDKNSLFNQLRGLDLTIAAEHGAYIFEPKIGNWQSLLTLDPSLWYSEVLEILDHYTHAVPGSFIERKNACVAWHYRQADPEFATHQARKLWEELVRGLAGLPVSIIKGKRVIEVRSIEANKGLFARWYLARAHPSHFVLAIGDDQTDADLFRAVAGHGLRFRVGELPRSHADYEIPQYAGVLPTLNRLLNIYDLFMSHLKEDNANSSTY